MDTIPFVNSEARALNAATHLVAALDPTGTLGLETADVIRQVLEDARLVVDGRLDDIRQGEPF